MLPRTIRPETTHKNDNYILYAQKLANRFCTAYIFYEKPANTESGFLSACSDCPDGTRGSSDVADEPARRAAATIDLFSLRKL